MFGTPRRRLALAGLLSLGAVVFVPSLLIAALFVDHAIGYSGTCGPYAPDIAEHACGFERYAANFFGGFSGIGLFLIAVVVAIATSAVVACAWVVFGMVAVIQRVRSRAARSKAADGEAEWAEAEGANAAASNADAAREASAPE